MQSNLNSLLLTCSLVCSTHLLYESQVEAQHPPPLFFSLYMHHICVFEAPFFKCNTLTQHMLAALRTKSACVIFAAREAKLKAQCATSKEF